MSRAYQPTSVWLFCLVLVFALLQLFGRAVGDCECGYTSVINSTIYTFTDVIETDFLHLDDIAQDTDWVRQGYNVSAAVSRGVYGTAFEVDNVVANVFQDNSSYTGPTMLEGDPGLQLYVRGGVPATGFVPTAEIDSARTDLLWGSFRAAMKLTDMPGTCAAFFWYFNDSQEIDMEFLSHQFVVENNTFPVNLVMQSAQSAAQGYQSEGKNYVVVNLPFNPTTSFHEYRIDFVPGNVYFYADSMVLGNINTSALPTMPGHLILTHWSNGNTGWSYGPPTSDAVLAVSYVKSYFNSSLSTRMQDWHTRCTNSRVTNAVCAIPNQVTAPDPDGPNGNVSADTFFFSKTPNSTNNQTIYHQSAARPTGFAWWSMAVLILGTTVILFGEL